MTNEMLSLARDNQRRAGVENAEFLKGMHQHSLRGFVRIAAAPMLFEERETEVGIGEGIAPEEGRGESRASPEWSTRPT